MRFRFVVFFNPITELSGATPIVIPCCTIYEEVMNNELVVDVAASEITIALLEDKQLVELHKEQSNANFSVGDIYLGRVKKIMPPQRCIH